MDTDISTDIHGKSVDMDMDEKFHIHGKPGYSHFSVKNAHHSYLFHSTPNLKTFPLHYIAEILLSYVDDTKLITRFSLRPTV